MIRRKELGRCGGAAAGEETPGRAAHRRHRHLHAEPDAHAANAQQVGVEARRMQAVGAPGAVRELRRVERDRRGAGAERGQARHRPAGIREHTVLARAPEVARIVDSRRRRRRAVRRERADRIVRGGRGQDAGRPRIAEVLHVHGNHIVGHRPLGTEAIVTDQLRRARDGIGTEGVGGGDGFCHHRAAVVRRRQRPAVQHLHLVAGNGAHRADVEPAVGVEEHDAHAHQEAAHAFVHERTAVRRGVHEQLAAGVDGADDVGRGARVRHVDHADGVGTVEHAGPRVVDLAALVRRHRRHPQHQRTGQRRGRRTGAGHQDVAAERLHRDPQALLHVGHLGLHAERELRPRQHRARRRGERQQDARRDEQFGEAHGRRRARIATTRAASTSRPMGSTRTRRTSRSAPPAGAIAQRRR